MRHVIESSLNTLFSPEQVATLRSALDRIIPADGYPSAWDAGVGDYLSRQLASDLSDLLDSYRTGIDCLERESVARFGAGFAALDSSRQDELLAILERGEVVSSWPISPSQFVEMLARHAAEGFYGDPGSGGNRDCVSWTMVGFDPHWTVSDEEAGP